MPKYRIEASVTADFEIDTDDYIEEFKEDDLDPDDGDIVHDFVHNLIENEGISEFDSHPMIDQIRVTPQPKPKK